MGGALNGQALWVEADSASVQVHVAGENGVSSTSFGIDGGVGHLMAEPEAAPSGDKIAFGAT